MSDESPIRIERVTSITHEVARMERARKISGEIEQLMEAAGMKDWSFTVCAWTQGEQPVVVAGIRKGCDVLESVKDGAQWLLKSVEAKQNGDAMPVVVGRP